MAHDRKIRSGFERLLHWLNAAAILTLIFSGWEVFNAAPFYPISFPDWITLGTDLTTGLLWHFAAMWLFLVSLGGFLIRRLILKKGVPLTPISPSGFVNDLRAAAKGNLGHDFTVYNQVQRLLYLGVVVIMIIAFLSGLALWKPVQFSFIGDTLGGYEWVRRWHFWAMASFSSFTLPWLFWHPKQSQG